ncbi:hypothetical protein ABEF95_001945 [Exophiala dermatitidis]
MSQPFSFPPPPPPPPKRNTQGAVQQNAGSGFHNNRGSFRGGPSSRGGGFRGGRGGYAGGGQHAPTGYSRSQPNTFSNGPHRGSFVNGAQKRDHASAFPGPSMNQARPRPVAPPAVPSFNASIEHLLPQKPPEPQTQLRSTTVPKPRKHNLLGLTPASLDQASDPEDDEGEEDRLVTQVTPSGQAQALQFEYKGRLATLRTPEEIAAWIAERKKRYPTLAKAEAAKKEAAERKRKWEVEKQARLDAKKEAQAKREQERNERERAKRQQREQIAQDKQNEPQVDTATLAKERAEKLRKKALRAERQLAKAEEALRVAEAKANANAKTTTQQLPTTANGSDAQPVSDAVALALAAENEPLDTSSDSEPTDSDDYTSSSGSSGTDTESEAGSPSDEASDSDSAPEVVSTKGGAGALAVDGPGLPPVRKPTASTRPCRNLIKFGRCKFGSNCRFSHEKQNHNAETEEGTQNARRKFKGKNKNPAIAAPTTNRRKGLFQVMVEKEQEEERRRLLEAIITLGEKGMLDDPAAAGTPMAKTTTTTTTTTTDVVE